MLSDKDWIFKQVKNINPVIGRLWGRGRAQTCKFQRQKHSISRIFAILKIYYGKNYVFQTQNNCKKICNFMILGLRNENLTIETTMGTTSMLFYIFSSLNKLAFKGMSYYTSNLKSVHSFWLFHHLVVHPARWNFERPFWLRESTHRHIYWFFAWQINIKYDLLRPV